MLPTNPRSSWTQPATYCLARSSTYLWRSPSTTTQTGKPEPKMPPASLAARHGLTNVPATIKEVATCRSDSGVPPTAQFRRSVRHARQQLYGNLAR